MILMPKIFDVTANENARYKRNELEFLFTDSLAIREVYSRIDQLQRQSFFYILVRGEIMWHMQWSARVEITVQNVVQTFSCHLPSASCT